MKKVLVIEDQGSYAFMIHRAFEEYMPGWEVLIAESMRDALIICAQSKIDLVILDLALPDSPTDATVETIPEIRRFGIPVVILTGSEVRGKPIFTDCFAFGADDVWEKTTLHASGLLFFIYACNSAIARNEAHAQNAPRPQ